ncbi:hypothetical protein LX81_00700 [Palleronia aestuarii]|uniref:Inner membrane protein n=1 Tax=Palleronia aestuarii TaxID=568105 RepID=A0A2W7P0M3_9RHOB|nr:hypothetical protein [Palleronia aestuarii]PZX19006.1 hypothetical protein LX81_00700 [Palleronia aestuarii]
MAKPDVPPSDSSSSDSRDPDATESREDIVEPGTSESEPAAPGETSAMTTDVVTDSSEPEDRSDRETIVARDPEPRRSGSGGAFAAALLGGFLAGAIGYLAAYYTEFGLFDGGTDDIAASIEAQSARIGQIEETLGAPDENAARLTASEDALTQTGGRIDTLEGRISEQQSRIDSLEEALGGLGDGGEGSDALAALDAASQERVADLTSRIDELQQTVSTLSDEVSTEDGPSDAVTALQQQVETLSTQVSDQAARIEDQASQITAARDAATEETRRISSEAAIAEIGAAVENGTPFAESVAAFQTASDIPVPSAFVENGGTGVATLGALQRDFSDAARDALSASISETAGDGAIDRIGAFLRAQTGARSLGEREGSGADAILSRAEARLQDGELQATLDELGALPEAGRNAMSDWISRAEARLQTSEAVAQVSQSLNGN